MNSEGEGGGRRTGMMGSRVSQEAPPLPLFFLIGHKGTAYLHDNEKVEDQDEGGQEGSGDLIARQEAPVEVVPADPVSTDDQNHYRRQRDEHCPAGQGRGGECRGETNYG